MSALPMVGDGCLKVSSRWRCRLHAASVLSVVCVAPKNVKEKKKGLNSSPTQHFLESGWTSCTNTQAQASHPSTLSPHLSLTPSKSCSPPQQLVAPSLRAWPQRTVSQANHEQPCRRTSQQRPPRFLGIHASRRSCSRSRNPPSS